MPGYSGQQQSQQRLYSRNNRNRGRRTSLGVFRLSFANERNRHSTSERPDADRVVGNKAQDAIVVWLSGMLAEFDNAFLLAGFLRRVGIGQFGNAADNGLGGQVKVSGACRNKAGFADRTCA
jgi:hypothetical protein